MQKLNRYIYLLKKSKFGLTFSPSSILNYLKYYIVARTPTIEPSRLSPVMVTLLVTSRCNFKCSFCVLAMQESANLQERLELDMDVKFVEKILDLEISKRSLVVALSGGEPLLNKSIIDIVKAVKKKRKLCGIITNGSLLPQHLDNLINANLDDIQVSVYRSYLATLRKTLPDMCKAFPINASYTLLRSEIEKCPDEVEAVIDFCHASGCRSLKFSLCVPYGNDESETIYDDTFPYLTFKKHMQEKYRKFNVFFPSPVSRKIETRSNKKCYLPWQLLLIDALGRMAMCCGYEPIKDAPANILEKNPLDSYNNPLLQNIRKKMLSDNSEIYEKCRSCPHRCGSYTSRV